MGDFLFILLQRLLPQHGLSRLVGLFTQSHNKWIKQSLIGWFIKRYQVDMSLAEQQDIKAFTSFNDFFVRRLKAGVRPLAIEPTALVSPADGVVSQFGCLEGNKLIQAKGKYFTLESLLANQPEVSAFIDGEFATIYLSPKDYHRVHMPFNGKLIKTIYIPGKLFSVNPVTTKHVDNLFARNERLVCLFETEFGIAAVILVGAMLVASISTVWAGTIAPNKSKTVDITIPQQSIMLKKGDELGYFSLGSTVIVLMPAKTFRWDAGVGINKFVEVNTKIATLVNGLKDR